MVEILSKLSSSEIAQCSACNNIELSNILSGLPLHPRNFFIYYPYNCTNNDALLIEYHADYSNVVSKSINLDFLRVLENPRKVTLKVLTSCDYWLLVRMTPNFNPLLRLVNPITRRCLILPNHIVKGPSGFGQIKASVYGIGCSRTTEGYKVVRLTKLRHNRKAEFLWYVEVLDLGRRPWSSHELEWRHIDWDGPVLGEIENQPVVLNGAIHWQLRRFKNRTKWFWDILRFDIDKEEFDLVATPEKKFVERFRNGLLRLRYDEVLEMDSLGSIGGSLCVSITTNLRPGVLKFVPTQHQQRRLEVWVMKEYGVEESWTLLFSTIHHFGRVIHVLEDWRILITPCQYMYTPELNEYSDPNRRELYVFDPNNVENGHKKLETDARSL